MFLLKVLTTIVVLMFVGTLPNIMLHNTYYILL